MGDIKANESLAANAALLSDLVSAAFQPSLKANGLTQSSFNVLSAIKASGGGANQVQISGELGITAPSLSEMVKNLAKNGLIEQVISSQDGRAKSLTLTKKAESALGAVVSSMSAIEEALTKGLSPNEVRVVVRLLRTASGNLAKHIGNMTP